MTKQECIKCKVVQSVKQFTSLSPKTCLSCVHLVREKMRLEKMKYARECSGRRVYG